MPKEILLYGQIGNYSAESFIESLQEIEDDSLVVRMNTTGGDVLAGYGMIAKFAEFKGDKKIKVDGQAASMGAFFLAYANDVEALDVSTFMIHRAAFPNWYESREGFKGSSEYNELVNINSFLRKGLESKIDIESFEKITGNSLDEVFSMESRLDIVLNAKQANKIGLINKVNSLSPDMAAKINSNIALVASDQGLKNLFVKSNANENKSNNNKNKIKMTVDQLKSEHYDVFKSVFEAGSESGVKAERDRSSAWLAFMDADKETVVNAIKGGKEFTTSDMADMNVKLVSALKKDEIEAGSPDDVATGDVTHDTESPTALSVFEKELDNHLKIKK
ncbi:MAG: ATP-dependent Clp protease proteolytic subunit [Vicingaceae bacterium]